MKNDPETTPPTEHQVEGASSGRPQLKRLKSTPFRQSLDPVRLHGLRRIFRDCAAWIQLGSEVTPALTRHGNVDDFTGNVTEEERDEEVEERNRKDLSSTTRRKRKNILRGVTRIYARYAD